jgi:carbon-monoxide dehydrogenase large subunit
VPGVIHLAILRSPHAHAVARNVNLDGARTAPGLSVALAGADLVGKVGSI